MSYNLKALKQYNSIDIRTSVDSASPHKLIIMLFDGAMTAITRAKGLIGQKDMAGKGQQIQKASEIMIGLKGSLDLEEGGEVAANLDALYDYILGRLMIANRNVDVAPLNEVTALLAEIKSGWEAIPPELHK
ncbi:MAG: flagellar protein FliS [Motiliproteus sp.]|jgi:flagellar protein FliS